VADERRFFASATAPPTAGLAAAAVRLAVVIEALAESLAAVADLVVAAPVALSAPVAVAGFGELTAAAVVGFRTVEVEDDEDPIGFLSVGLAGDDPLVPVVADVRRAAAGSVEEPGVTFFLSSSDTDAWARCVTVVVPVAGRFTVVEETGARVGGLPNPLVVVEAPVRATDVAVGFVPLAAATPGRRVAVVDGPAVVFFTGPLVDAAGFVPFVVGVSVIDSSTLSAGASLC
jgi:hypothetical protein